MMKHSDTYYFDIIRYNIKKYREAANLTQQQLADKAGITMNYVAKIESKKMQRKWLFLYLLPISTPAHTDSLKPTVYEGK